MKNSLAVELILIFFSLIVIAGGILLGVDFYGETRKRDGQRITMLNKVKESLETYYDRNNNYPGTPRLDENNLLIYADWHYLITTPEMKDYYNFAQFKDPCQPQVPVSIDGVVKCPAREIQYHYVGIDCEVGCQGFRLWVDLENGGRAEMNSKTIK